MAMHRPVFHMNSWLSGALGLSDPNRADQANDVDFLVNRSIECYEHTGIRHSLQLIGGRMATLWKRLAK